MTMNDESVPPAGRVRMPFPVPQHKAASGANDDPARYRTEAASGRPTENNVMALSTAGFGLFHTLSDATLTVEQAEFLGQTLKDQALAASDLLPKLPMPQGDGITDADAAAGKVYAPYMFLMGLNLIAHGMAEVSPQTTLCERLALISEFVRSWAMMSQLAAISEVPGMTGTEIRHIAAGHVVIQPPFLPAVSKLASQVRELRKAEEAKFKLEPEREIPVEAGDGVAGVKRPKFKLD